MLESTAQEEMPEFKTLPPLSPERLAELVSASPDDDDDQFVRHWFTGEYEAPALEAAYRVFHLQRWAPRVRLLLGICAISMLVILHIGNREEVVLSSNRLSVPIASHSDPIFHSLQPRALQVTPILHPAIYASRAVVWPRWLMCGFMMATSLGFDRVATADNYQRLLFTVAAVSCIIETFPLLYFRAQLLNEETDLAVPSNSSWSHDPVRTAQACYWHATWTDVCFTSHSSPHTAKPCRNTNTCTVVSRSGQRLTECSRCSDSFM